MEINHAGLLDKVKSYGIFCQGFWLCLFISLFCFVFCGGKCLQGPTIITGVSQGSVLILTLFQLYSNDLSNDVISHVAVYAEDTTFCM